MSKQRIIDYRFANPKATLQQIGDAHGISRERVRQILKSAGAPTRSTFSKRISVECANCEAVITRAHSVLERHLKDPRYKGRYFCNNFCKGQYAGKHYGFRTLEELRELEKQRLQKIL